MHFGGVWGVVGRDEFGGFGSCRARDGAAGGGVGAVDEFDADGLGLTVRGEGRGGRGGEGSGKGMRLRVSRERSRRKSRRIVIRGLDGPARTVESGAGDGGVGIRGTSSEGCNAVFR